MLIVRVQFRVHIVARVPSVCSTRPNALRVVYVVRVETCCCCCCCYDEPLLLLFDAIQVMSMLGLEQRWNIDRHIPRESEEDNASSHFCLL